MISVASPSPLTLSIQPLIQITYTDGQQTTKVKIITVRVYKYVDIEKTYEDLLQSLNGTLATYDSVLSDANSNQSASSNGVKSTLSNMWQIVSNAGKLNKEVTQTYEPVAINFTTPNETTDSNFVFKDLQITFVNYGKYQLMIIVDGIESGLSDVIEIKTVATKVQEIKVNFHILNYSIFFSRPIILSLI